MESIKAVLYHGTKSVPFDRFDLSRCLTARHIYTTPDKTGAQFFGENVLTFSADMHNAIDLSDPCEPNTHDTLSKLYEEIAQFGPYPDFEQFLGAYTDGRLYQDMASASFQDRLLEEIFSLGYDPAIIPDQLGGGRVGTAVVFNNPRLLTKATESKE